MRSIAVRSLIVTLLLLAGCGGAQRASTSSGAPALRIAAVRTQGKAVVATAMAPRGWLQDDALTRGDDLAALVHAVRAGHHRGAVRVEVTAGGKVVAVADSPGPGRISFSMKK